VSLPIRDWLVHENGLKSLEHHHCFIHSFSSQREINLLYLLIFYSILLLFRPTDKNQRYVLDHLAQDEDEYEGLELEMI
jgi:hypothetical protein